METATRISLFTATLMMLITLALLHDLYLTLLGTGWSLLARILSLLLVSVTFFGVIQFMSYADHLLRSLYAYPERAVTLLRKAPRPSRRAAVFIPVYNEDPDVVESCIRACMAIAYPDVRIFLLDDSTDAKKRASMQEISHRYGLRYVHRDHRRGFKAGAINHALSLLDSDMEYLLVLDADQRVKPTILADLIPILEANPDASFIQTPQFFRSEPNDPISVTFSYQQHIYNKHVCRGLSVNQTAVLTGSNCIFRVSHLVAIGGMDETCIAEDIATSFAFHFRGCRGIFLDTVYAEGIAPPNLAAYFTQQLRWAYGNTQLLGTILRTLVASPRSMTAVHWLEFIVIVSIYLLGGVNVALFLLPIATLILGIPILPVWLPPIFAVVLAVVIAIQVIISVRERQYSLRDLALSQAIFNTLAFVYARAIVYAASGKKLPFVVTPKALSGSAGRARVRIAPVLFVISAVLVSIFFGVMRLLADGPDSGTTIPLFWACYTLIVLSSFLVVWRRDGRRVQAAGTE
ncbi:glycosyltransferase [Methanoculleus sp. DTU007]|jgi:cellulose synthase (UDP-forming)|uniref:glycosyltransferase n=1 Tax=Methanoculleus TaxID=45989 RepID=UPI000B32B741|nr:glycosyltransferase [Methanoculleus sp. DTU007]NLN09344.1 glycosyltransferase [Methanoculleus thermophilus]HQD25071.1 glycosyltransferase [Methanoculleus thermophilus]